MNIAGLFVLLGFIIYGVIFSFFMLIIECVMDKRREKKEMLAKNGEDMEEEYNKEQ